MNAPSSQEAVPWSPSLVRKLDEVCVRFEKAWRDGSSTRPRLEEYLGEVPHCARGPAVEELLALELAYRCQSGERPTVEEYDRRLPGHLSTIRVVFGEMAQPPAAGPVPPTTPEGILTTDEVAPLPGLSGSGTSTEDGKPDIPGYEVLGELGRGGMGVVYKARHLPLKRVVALKMILAGAHAEPELLSRFRREAEAVARLQHPNIVQVYEIGEHQGLPFFSLEFVEGGSLDRRIRGAPQPAVPAAELVETLARAMHAAHERGIVHRDLKPANVLLQGKTTTDHTDDTDKKRPGASSSVSSVESVVDFFPKITDFGLAKRLDEAGEAQTGTGAVVGTYRYMAPEQAWGRAREVGPLADVYALGVILYELLTGRVPFLGENALRTLEQVRTHDPVPPRRLQPAVPRDLEKVCLKCLEKEPRKRYASALDLADDLHRFLKGEPVRARLITPVRRALKWARRRPAAALAAVALVLAAAGVLSTLVVYSLYTAQQSHYTAEQKSQQLAALQKQVAERDARISQANRGRDFKAAGKLEEAKEKLTLALNGWGPELGDDTGERLGIEKDLNEVERLLSDRKLARDLKDHIERSRLPISEVSFREISFTESAQEADRAAICTAAPAALAEFDLSAKDTPAEAASRLQTYREAAESPRQLDTVAADCYQVLLAWAEAEAPPGANDRAGADRALHLLELAAALGGAHHLPTPRAFYLRRARYLDLAGRAVEARADREQAAGMQPETALDLFLTALESYGQGRWVETAATCEQVMRKKPDHFWAQYLEALCHMRTRHWGEAKAELTACLSRQPSCYWWRLQRATAESELGYQLNQPNEYEAAEKDFADVLTGVEDPAARRVALINRGVMWARRHRWDDAIADFQQAIALAPDVPETYRNLAYAYRGRKDWQAAVAALDQAAARHPDDPGLDHDRAELDLERGDPAAARHDFEQAIAHEPAGSTSERLGSDYAQLAHLQHLAGEPETALDSCAAALRIRPDYALAHRPRAEALLALGRYEDAGKALDRYLLREKPTATVYRVRGLIHAGLRRYPEAVEAYSRSLALQQDARTLAYRGWAYVKLDAPRPALLDFDAALRLDAAQTDALCGRGYARVRLGRLAEGVADAEECLRHGRPAALLLLDAACVYALSVGELDRRAGGRLSVGGPAARYQERAVDLLRAALDAKPAGQRREFWRANIANAADLVPIRRSTSFLELARSYPR